MSVKNPNDRIHSFVIASALGFSHDFFLNLIRDWDFKTEFPYQWNFLICPAEFKPDNNPTIDGYSFHFSAVKKLIEFLNQTFEFCQTNEFIGRAQSFLFTIYKNHRCNFPRIYYQVR